MTQEEKVSSATEDVICNQCGNSCFVSQCIDGSGDICCLTLDLSKMDVYGSKFDDVRCFPEQLHLCAECTIKLLAGLKIPPRVSECSNTEEPFFPTAEGEWSDDPPEDIEDSDAFYTNHRLYDEMQRREEERWIEIGKDKERKKREQARLRNDREAQ